MSSQEVNRVSDVIQTNSLVYRLCAKHLGTINTGLHSFPLFLFTLNLILNLFNLNLS
jgi:hypothetical protein